MRLKIVKRGPRSPAPFPMSSVVSARRARVVELENELVDAARRQAAATVAAAVEESDRIWKAAADEGRAEGEREWAEAAVELATRQTEAAASIERNCVELAVAIARQIVAAELELSDSAIARIAERACADLRRDARLVLRIGPADASRTDAIVSRLGNRGPIDVEVDLSLAPGECVAECAGVRVDATVDAQLVAIERRLLGETEGERP